MKTIIIPGYSISNKGWAEETVNRLGGINNSTTVYYWKHWTDSKTPVLKNAKEIINQIRKCKTNVIAKSIGTLAMAYILPEIKDLVNKIILCGLPLNDISEKDREIYKTLSTFDAAKILVIQNSDDKHCTFEEAKKFLKSINPEIKIISKDSDTHDYPYFKEFSDFL